MPSSHQQRQEVAAPSYEPKERAESKQTSSGTLSDTPVTKQAVAKRSTPAPKKGPLKKPTAYDSDSNDDDDDAVGKAPTKSKFLRNASMGAPPSRHLATEAVVDFGKPEDSIKRKNPRIKARVKGGNSDDEVDLVELKDDDLSEVLRAGA